MARNYVLAYAVKFQAAQGPSDPFPGLTTDLGAWEGTPERLYDRVNEVFTQFVANNPGYDWQGPLFPNAIKKCYVLIDKDTVITALQGGDIFNDLYFYIYAVDNITGTQAWPMQIDPKVSPRYTGWTDPAGETHKVTPSDKKGAKSDFGGATNLVEGFLSVMERAIASAGPRAKGILQGYLDAFLSGKMSITQILALIVGLDLNT